MPAHICKECGHFRDFGKSGKYCTHMRMDVMAREPACKQFITPAQEESGYERAKMHRSWNAIDQEHRRHGHAHMKGVHAKGILAKERNDYRPEALKTSRTYAKKGRA